MRGKDYQHVIGIKPKCYANSRECLVENRKRFVRLDRLKWRRIPNQTLGTAAPMRTWIWRLRKVRHPPPSPGKGGRWESWKRSRNPKSSPTGISSLLPACKVCFCSISGILTYLGPTKDWMLVYSRFIRNLRGKTINISIPHIIGALPCPNSLLEM